MPIAKQPRALVTSALHVTAVVFLTALPAACVRTPTSPCSAPAASASPMAVPLAAISVSQPSLTTPAPPTLAPPMPLPAVSPSEPSAAFTQATESAKKAVSVGDYATADRQIEAAAAAAGGDVDLRFDVARLRAARFASSGDLERAAAALVSLIPELAKHPESDDEFWAHNVMMMIRESQGDPAAALAENDQATLAAARGTWEPQQRETLAYLKDRWHRAYLTRMLAETRKGTVREALVHYAEAALDDYRLRARQLGSNDESIDVLEAYFAALDGNQRAALEAARKVDPAKDDDLEDLYLVVVGLEAGGDHAGAEAVKQRMRQSRGAGIARTIMLRWLELDAKAPHDRRFTPRHPS
jgi:hypothetical protein